MGSGLFSKQSGLARYGSAPSSFLSGDESVGLFWQKNGIGGSEIEYQLKEEVGDVGHESGSVVGSYSNLRRQTSSPAGFFNGFGVMGDIGNCRVHNNHQKTNPSAAHSSPRFMPSIPEIVIEPHSPENGQVGDANVSNFDGVFPQESLHEPPLNTLKRKSSSTSSEIEKVLFSSGAVPCQVRAKRGCATHPRSIAERVRRTRISEKMKKLQDLFPNMDKQTSTADMLEMAVEYIKELQAQVQGLMDKKAKCVCSTKYHHTT